MAEGDHLPEQVRRQIERAQQLSDELAASQPPSIEGDGDALTAEGQPQGDTTVVERGVEPPPPPAGDPPAAPPASTSEWEQRYRTLQGKYDSEIPQLRGQIQSLERLISTVQTPPQQAEPPRKAGGPLSFEEADVDIYGQEFLEAAARAAAARYEPEIAELRATIRQLQGGQQDMSHAEHERRMFAELDKDPELAGWAQINRDTRFHQWLQGVDEYSGVPRSQMLQHAYASGDAIRTGRFFKKYMAETGHTAPRPTMPTPQTGYVPRPNGDGRMVTAGGSRLEEMVVPGRAAGPGGSGNGAQNPRIWSRADITRFYRDRTDGKYRGREDEASRLEQDLFRADAEGRIH